MNLPTIQGKTKDNEDITITLRGVYQINVDEQANILPLPFPSLNSEKTEVFDMMGCVRLLTIAGEASAGPSNQLNGALTNSATTITVDSTTDFDSKGFVQIESEIIYYSGTTATTLTGCIRGFGNSTAASHLDNLAVYNSTKALAEGLLSLNNGNQTELIIGEDESARFTSDQTGIISVMIMSVETNWDLRGVGTLLSYTLKLVRGKAS